MSETVSASVPINIRWTQEFVDDGAGGSKFYIRLTPKIDMRGRGRVAKIDNLMTVVQRLKREKSNEIQRAAKYGMETALKSVDYDAQRRKRELAEYQRQAKIAEESRQYNDYGSFNVGSSTSLQKAFEAEVAANKDATKGITFEKEEKEDDVQQEEIYYIK